MSGKLLNGINSMCLNGLVCVRVKGSKNECFRIESCVRQDCIISPCHLYMDAMIKEVKMMMGRMGVRFLEEV